MSAKKCDDGNTLSGDGCDENCQIEEGWFCSSKDGSEHGMDECKKDSGPVCSISQVN